MPDIQQWLESIGLGKYTRIFLDNDIGIDIVADLTDEDFKELGVSLGDRKRLIAILDGKSPNVIGATDTDQTADSRSEQAERRHLTVMFCDLADSTALSENFDPEDLGEIIRKYRETCTDIILSYEGYIARYMGDGILVYFGYPVAHEEDAERALHTGLQIINSVQSLEPSPGLSLSVRVGVASGPVVVGETIGDSASREQLALGETPNLASRLQGLAKTNALVISENTRALAGDSFDYEDLGYHQLKGFSEQVHALRVTGIHKHREKLEGKPKALSLPMVAREQEMAVVAERWASVLEGNGQMVFVSGEPGIGKSRFIQAIREQIVNDDTIQMVYRCSSYHKSNALYPIRSYLDRVLANEAVSKQESDWGRLGSLLSRYAFVDDESELLIAKLLGIPAPSGTQPLKITPEQEKEKTYAAILAWIEEQANHTSVLLVWEDLHCIDPSTLEFLLKLIDRLPAFKIMVVATARPEFEPPWGLRSNVTPVSLNRLSGAFTEKISQNITRGITLPTEILTLIKKRTDGIPLFVEEMTRAILDSNVLTEENGQYAITSPIDALPIPLSLQELLLARLDSLGQAKNIAQIASVVGRKVSYKVLKALTSDDENTLRKMLDQLVKAELLYPRGLPPNEFYLFKHALIQDTAYNSLLIKRRNELHGAVAEAIENRQGGSPKELSAILAYHYSRSSHKDRAIRYALQAGDHATTLHAMTEAKIHYAHALEMLESEPDADAQKKLRIDAILKLASVGTSREDIDGNQKNLQQAQTLAETFNDADRLSQVFYWQGRISYVLGDVPTTIDYAQRSIETADSLDDETSSAPAVNLLGRVSMLEWNLEKASALMMRSANQMQKIGNDIEESTAAAFAASNLGFLGRFDEALIYAKRGIDIAKSLNNPFAEAAGYFCQATVYHQQGEWDKAYADYARARNVAQEVGDAFRVYLVNMYHSWACEEAGDLVEGRKLAKHALDFADKIGTTFMLAVGKSSYAASHVGKVEPDKAITMCKKAIAFADSARDRMGGSIAHRALAEVLLDESKFEASQKHITEAIRLQNEIKNTPESARSLLLYAQLCLANGDQQKAQELWSKATDLFTGLNMQWDLNRSGGHPSQVQFRNEKLPG